MFRIFINDYGYPHNWIMGKIADDIMSIANKLGFECRCGGFEDYRGEEIYYHLDFHKAVPVPQAKHNSVFYTHINDSLKERNLLSLKDKFDSYICMSPEDAQFLLELGFDKNKVYGKVLPIRNTYIKPVSIGIFSACYEDERKNEQWLLDYCRHCDGAKYINFVFIGKGWDKILKEMENLGCTFEWHNVSRKLPYEYQFQQNKLASLNYYFYMGMDGGAMGTYDAYAQSVPLCVTYDGFHKSIPDLDFTFDDKQSFFNQMDLIVSKHVRRLDFFNENSTENYVKWLIDVWKGSSPDSISDKDKQCISYNTVLDKKRDQYYPLNKYKIIGYIEWFLFKRKTKKKYKL